MKIACLQFAPEVGRLEANIAKVDEIVEKASNVSSVDLLVLPELALTGYNFPSLEAITPFLEPTRAGPSTQWAMKTAKKLQCIVMVGYPELETTESPIHPISAYVSTPEVPSRASPSEFPSPILTNSSPVNPVLTSSAYPKRYNSLVAVSPTGAILAHYRKSFLYYTDESWASESPTGFTTFPLIPQSSASSVSGTVAHLSHVTPGICMDINPHRFLAPWTAFEFATHVILSHAQTAILSMAWLVHASPAEWAVEMAERGDDIDVSTLSYWVERLRPVVDRKVEAEGKGTLVVCANRTGIEGEACYAGSSCVMRVGSGEVEILGMLGKGEERVLVVDVDEGAKYRLRMEPVAKDGEGEG